jgi:ribonuclease P protein component
MFKKINRLTKDKEFDNVFNPPAGGGKSSFNKVTGLKVLANELKHNRFGILVSAKVSKKAVERNKIKRQIREVIKLESNKLKNGYDCVVVCLPEIANKTYKEIQQSINGHFKRLGLYK